ncbi:MAG: hypothetical protein Kow0042_00990 [Calditrichia bacterium]
MKDKQKQVEKLKEESREMAEHYYKKAIRVVEYYVLICFILITFIPLLNYSWVPPFVKFIYLTGFPLLIMLFLVSLVKEPLLKLITNLIEK